MPIYEYKCEKCESIYEKSIPIKEYSSELKFKCDKCKVNIKRVVLSPPGLAIPEQHRAYVKD